MGPRSDHLIGFDRGSLVAMATRLPVGLAARGGWGATHVRLPAGSWRDLLTGADHSGEVQVRTILSRFPVALLQCED
jgi:(1->4)-alpha-D-glucan 1-alpha-D-glucosylmutase